MATQTITHKDHEHILRTVKEEILGLKLDDTNGSQTISEAFGMNDEDFTKLNKAYGAYLKFTEAAEELDEDLPKGTFISNLVDFLKSPTYKKLGVKLTSVNDFFMLGYIAGIKCGEEKNNVIGELQAFKGSKEDLIRILKKIKEEMGG